MLPNMPNSREAERIAEHAHDISFAVFRVARLMKHRELRSEVENASIVFVRDLTEDAASALERLIRLSESVGEMNKINADVLHSEIRKFNSAIRQFHSAIAELSIQADISDLFGNGDGNSTRELMISDDAIADKMRAKRVREVQSMSPETRQSSVLEFIRQFPDGCRMKDISGEFEGVSERTIRADIQKLVDDGFVERDGGKSGPFSYLRPTEQIAIDR